LNKAREAKAREEAVSFEFNQLETEFQAANDYEGVKERNDQAEKDAYLKKYKLFLAESL
jgi:hypothetical protein